MLRPSDPMYKLSIPTGQERGLASERDWMMWRRKMSVNAGNTGNLYQRKFCRKVHRSKRPFQVPYLIHKWKRVNKILPVLPRNFFYISRRLTNISLQYFVKGYAYNTRRGFVTWRINIVLTLRRRNFLLNFSTPCI